MTIHILTLFPKMFQGPFNESIIKRAIDKKTVEIKIHNLRDWAIDKRGTVDDRPYGGGAGMIMRVEPVYRALRDLRQNTSEESLRPPRRWRNFKLKNSKKRVILFSPKGKTFNQQKAQKLSQLDEIILICGHYEGFDERIRNFVDEEISLGNFILTGGEIPAMAITDAVVRLLPGVLKKEEANQIESFSPSLETLAAKSAPKHQASNFKPQAYIEYPQYTRPENFHGLKVPEVLLSGNHQKISEWRAKHIKKQK